MNFVSTRDSNVRNHFKNAVFHGLAPDGGLFIPENIPVLKAHLQNKADDIHYLGYEMMRLMIDDIPSDALQEIINKTLTFKIPLIHLEANTYLLEVFHGPTLAFKDVGARFMANVMEYYLKSKNDSVTILVATSGDTGSAIANAFHNKENINIYIFYPSEKVTHLQEQQMTTLGGNIHAVEVQGTFDDCQKIVKSALMDNDLSRRINLTTANSINVARLLPQMIYHVWGLQQLKAYSDICPVLSVPSGNFGNLVSAVYAKKLGFGIEHFIAATNANNIVPDYLKTGNFEPRPSIKTYSNAMDVGNPSNFERLLCAYNDNLDAMRSDISGISISDEDTLAEIRRVYDETGYILDPHTAVGVAASSRADVNSDTPVIVTATAHPAKFPEVIRRAINIEPEIPERLQVAVAGKKQSIVIAAEYEQAKDLLE